MPRSHASVLLYIAFVLCFLPSHAVRAEYLNFEAGHVLEIYELTRLDIHCSGDRRIELTIPIHDRIPPGFWILSLFEYLRELRSKDPLILLS